MSPARKALPANRDHWVWSVHKGHKGNLDRLDRRENLDLVVSLDRKAIPGRKGSKANRVPSARLDRKALLVKLDLGENLVLVASLVPKVNRANQAPSAPLGDGVSGASQALLA